MPGLALRRPDKKRPRNRNRNRKTRIEDEDENEERGRLRAAGGKINGSFPQRFEDLAAQPVLILGIHAAILPQKTN